MSEIVDEAVKKFSTALECAGVPFLKLSMKNKSSTKVNCRKLPRSTEDSHVASFLQSSSPGAD